MPIIYNERSWTIDVIAEIRRFAESREGRIKGATGEVGVSTQENALFPDVLLLGDSALSKLLQGWELKFPDTPIADPALLENAERKARALGLASFVVWNVADAALYVRNSDSDLFELEATWRNPSSVSTRSKARRMAPDAWVPMLHDVLIAVSRYFESGLIPTPTLLDAFRSSGIPLLVLRNARELARHLQSLAARDAQLDASITQWWRSMRSSHPDFNAPWVPLAELIIITWVARLLLAHAFKQRSDSAFQIDQLTSESTPSEGQEVLRRILAHNDLDHVLGSSELMTALDNATWDDLLEFNTFLASIAIQDVAPDLLHDILDRSVEAFRRKVAGQFATHPGLAQLLARLVLRNKADWSLLDPFCGTGTIARASLDVRAEYDVPIDAGLEKTWLTDKFPYPLQLALMSLASRLTAGTHLNAYCCDILDMKPGARPSPRDPFTFTPDVPTVPVFDCVASNLPFVRHEDLDDANPTLREEFEERFGVPSAIALSGRSDLYAYLPFFLWDLVRPDGVVGLILSNSWLGTSSGAAFRKALRVYFDIELVVTSAAGRWFPNTDVVASLLILRRRHELLDETLADNPLSSASANASRAISFATTRVRVSEVVDTSVCRELAADLLSGTSESDYASVRLYDEHRIAALEGLGMPWSALFADLDWLSELAGHLIPASSLLDIYRGARRGWNDLFYPEDDHSIEDEYLRPVLRSTRSVDYLIAEPDQMAFCCTRSHAELRELGHFGALAWIDKFATSRNGAGVPLPDVLSRPGYHWYEMREESVADIVCTVNPGSRLFLPRMKAPCFVDQRLIGFVARPGADLDLVHALLNSVVGLFYLEALGFGRGLGALDLSATKLREGLHVLNPEHIDPHQRENILGAFAHLLHRPVTPLLEELSASDRADFDAMILGAFGMSHLHDRIRDALTTLYSIRMAATS